MTTRLNQWMRDAILTKLIARAFDARELELKKLDKELAQDVYADLYSPKIQQAMAGLPAGFLPESRYVMVKFGETMDQAHWASGAEEARRIANVHGGRHSACARVYAPEHPLCVRHEKLRTLEQELSHERDEARRQIKAVLYSCSTVEKLIKTWPEMEEFAKGYLNAANRPTSTALAIPLVELNSLLKLPPEAVPA